MTEERIITAATITSGEKTDGKELKTLVEKSRKAGHLAVSRKKDNRGSSGKNPIVRYYFDIEKCKKCLYREGCYKEGGKIKELLRNDYM